MSTVTRAQMISRSRALIHGAGVSDGQPRLLFASFTTRRALQIEMSHMYARRYSDLVVLTCPDAPLALPPRMAVVSLADDEPLSTVWEIGAAAADSARVLTARAGPGEPQLTHADAPTRIFELAARSDRDARAHLHERLDQLQDRLAPDLLDEARRLVG